MTTPKLQMPELVVGQAGKELTHNQALAVLDQLAQAVVVDKDLTAPPGSPANGAMYIVAASATGAWSGQSGKLAYWMTTVAAWTFITPADGWSVWVTDEAVRYERKAGAWVIVATGGGASLSVVQTFTGAKTLALTDINTYNVSQDATAQTVTLPAQASVAWTVDAEITIEQGANGAVTITGASGVTINGVVAPSILLFAKGAVATLKRKGLNNWTLAGAIGTAAEQRAALGLGPITGINRIINGAFNINQRAVSGTVTLAAGTYGHDRWKAGASGCTYTFATAANVTTITITAGSLQQVIGGINLQSGTHTLSWSGTAQGKIGAGSYGASGITGSAVGGTNLTVEFNTGTLSFAQLQPGSFALPFDNRHYGQELAWAKQYFNTVGGVNSFRSVEGTSLYATCNQSFPTMRTTPSIQLVDPHTGAVVTTMRYGTGAISDVSIEASAGASDSCMYCLASGVSTSPPNGIYFAARLSAEL